MKQVLNKLLSTPGVVGACVYSLDRGILGKRMSEDFHAHRLMAIIRSMTKVFSASARGFSDLAEVSFVYDKTMLLVREPAKGHFLIVFSDTTADADRIALALNETRTDLVGLIERRKDIRNDKPASRDGRPAIRPVQSGSRANDLLNSSPMSKSLRAMRVSLTQVMGPVGTIVFNDALNNWIETDNPSFASMPGLVDILGDEISDAATFKDYQGRVIPFIEK